MTAERREPLLRVKTEVDGSDPWRLGSLVRRRVEVPPGTEVEVWPAGDRERLEAKLNAALQVAADSFRDALIKNTLGDDVPSICDELGIKIPEGTANYRVQILVIDAIRQLRAGDRTSPTREQAKKWPKVGSAALIVDGDRILLGKRAKEPNFGRWVMPGGKIEPGETIDHAVRREVWEETDLEVEVVARLGIFEIVQPEEHSVFVLSAVRVVEGPHTELAGDDLAEVAWFHRSELPNVDLSDPCREALRVVGWLSAQPPTGEETTDG